MTLNNSDINDNLPQPPSISLELGILHRFLRIVIGMIYKRPSDFFYIMDGIELHGNIIHYKSMCKTQIFLDFIGFEVTIKNQLDVNVLQKLFENNSFKIFGLQFKKVPNIQIFRVRMHETLIPDLEYNQNINFDTYDTTM